MCGGEAPPPDPRHPPAPSCSIDFSHEVARSLAACQGALVLIDAAQGVQAQTVANHNAAREAGLTIVPLLTKIDLPTADPEVRACVRVC